MIVLDTNVLSAFMQPEKQPAVWRWAGKIARADMVTTTINEAELRFGVARLPAGRRRDDLNTQLGKVLDTVLAGRILVFDRAATGHYAQFVAARFAKGKPVEAPDALIAAIARAHNASAIATRDLSGFEGCGVPLVDPWAA